MKSLRRFTILKVFTALDLEEQKELLEDMRVIHEEASNGESEANRLQRIKDVLQNEDNIRETEEYKTKLLSLTNDPIIQKGIDSIMGVITFGGYVFAHVFFKKGDEIEEVKLSGDWAVEGYCDLENFLIEHKKILRDTVKCRYRF